MCRNSVVLITVRSTGDQGCAFLYMSWEAMSVRKAKVVDFVERSRSGQPRYVRSALGPKPIL